MSELELPNLHFRALTIQKHLRDLGGGDLLPNNPFPSEVTSQDFR